MPTRVGGFGGAGGLARYIQSEGITHVVDATHPFAAQMSRNAVQACRDTDTPLVALTRPPWMPQSGDNWARVDSIAAAVDWLDRDRLRVMLAIGRMNLPDFAARPRHFYLLRVVDRPGDDIPLPDHAVVVDTGPFTPEGDIALMQAHGIELVVSKNAGGTGARAKIDAARELGLPVLMIDRPALPDREEVHDPGDVMRWLHAGTERGV